MKRFLVQCGPKFIVFALTLASTSAISQTSATQAAPEVIVEANRATWLPLLRCSRSRTAWAAGDAAAYVARVLPNVSFTNVVGAYSLGKEPLLKQVSMIFSTIYKGSHVKSQLVHASLIGDDVALVDLTTELRDFVRPPSGADVVDGAVHTRMQEVMVRREGKWWIASLHNVLVKAAFLPGASAPK